MPSLGFCRIERVAGWICQVEGCDRQAFCRGWCTLHYARWRKHGDTATVGRSRWHPAAPCGVDKCALPAYALGFCPKHYGRLKRTGDPLGLKNSTRFLSLSERFWAKVDKDGPIPAHAPHLGPCWCWLRGCVPDGYGSFGTGGRRVVGAHRVAYTLLVGPIPPGLTIDHLCWNVACVNPSHMELVTNSENVRRSWANQRRRSTRL